MNPKQDAAHLKQQGTNSVRVDYNNMTDLTEHLRGVHTVLSFIVALEDTEGAIQKNLINACIAAGVKRFAPSEWAT